MRSRITLYRLLLLGLGLSLFVALVPINAARAGGGYERHYDGGSEWGSDDPNQTLSPEWGDGAAAAGASTGVSFDFQGPGLGGAGGFSCYALAAAAVWYEWVPDPNDPNEVPPGGTVNYGGSGSGSAGVSGSSACAGGSASASGSASSDGGEFASPGSGAGGSASASGSVSDNAMASASVNYSCGQMTDYHTACGSFSAGACWSVSDSGNAEASPGTTGICAEAYAGASASASASAGTGESGNPSASASASAWSGATASVSISF